MTSTLSSNPLPSPSASEVTIVSECTIYPDQKSTMGDLKLSVCDLPILSCHYAQKGLFFPPPPTPIAPDLLSLLKTSLSRALSFFPVLAGRLSTAPDGAIYISCNDAGAEFSHAVAPSLTLPLLLPSSSDVPPSVKSLFAMNGVVNNYQGHYRPLASFQVTELGDGAVFIGCTINHAVLDGTSFWNFFNAWAELCRGGAQTTKLSHPPDFRRNFFGESKAVLKFPGGGGPEVIFPMNAVLRERVFHFSRDAIAQLKSKANNCNESTGGEQAVHDPKREVISSFQSLCAQLWISVTRSRKLLGPDSKTTFFMVVNCRRRIVPPVDSLYFGNAIQTIPVTATAGEVIANGLSWTANLLHRAVASYDYEKIRKVVEEWEAAPKCISVAEGATVIMGSSPRFPMYERNDFGWGQPLAVRGGKVNKLDGKMAATPGRNGDGSVDVEVCLAPENMAGLLEDEEFMYYAYMY